MTFSGLIQNLFLSETIFFSCIFYNQNYKSDESCANDIEVHCFNNGNCGVFCQDGGAPIGIKSFQCISTGKKKKQGWTNSGRFSIESLILSHDKLLKYFRVENQSRIQYK